MSAVDIDVTPVMNMFIILVPYLVGMAVFTQIAVQSFSLPGDEAAGHAQTATDLPLTVAVAIDRIVIARGDQILATVPGGAQTYDLGGLEAALRRVRSDLPGAQRLVVAVDDPITCEVVVACLDRCRMAGFAGVGLAAGTNLDR